MKRIVFIIIVLCLAGCQIRRSSAVGPEAGDSSVQSVPGDVPAEDFIDGIYDSCGSFDKMFARRCDILAHPDVEDCYDAGGNVVVVLKDGSSFVYYFNGPADAFEVNHVDLDALLK